MNRYAAEPASNRSRRTSTRLCVLVAALLLAPPLVAENLCVSFEDAVGDALPIDSGNEGYEIDIVALALVLDTATGNYYGQLFTDPSTPFVGEYSYRVRLYDVDRGPAPADSLLDLYGTPTQQAPSASRILFGNVPAIQGWAAGDRVALDDAPFGAPGGVVAFTSYVRRPWDDEGDLYDGIASGQSATLVPCAGRLFATGFERGDLRNWSQVMP